MRRDPLDPSYYSGELGQTNLVFHVSVKVKTSTVNHTELQRLSLDLIAQSIIVHFNSYAIPVHLSADSERIRISLPHTVILLKDYYWMCWGSGVVAA